METSRLIQHLKTGYDKEVWLPFQKYRHLLEKYNFEDSLVPAWPELGGIRRGYGYGFLEPFKNLPEEVRNELKRFRSDLLTNLYRIMTEVKHGSPLDGECDFCSGRKVVIKELNER